MNAQQYNKIAQAISDAEYETGNRAMQTKDGDERAVLTAAAELIEQAGKMIRQWQKAHYTEEA